MSADFHDARAGFWRRLWRDVRQGVRAAAPRPHHVRDHRHVPLMQLVLFGYAINTQPRDLPTAVLLQETATSAARSSRRWRTPVFQGHPQLRDEAEMDRVLASGEVLFAVEIPARFRAGVAARRQAGAAGGGRRHRSGGDRLGAWARSTIC